MKLFIKKAIISLFICILACCSAYAFKIPISLKPLPSETYINRLKVCGAYKESIFYNIPLNPLGTRAAHFKETISIIGIRNGKCSIKSKVYLKDIDQIISVTNCQLTEQQRKTLADKIKTANTSQKRLDEYINYYNYLTTRSPNTCKIKNYLDE